MFMHLRNTKNAQCHIHNALEKENVNANGGN